ncbi:hypothetical protein [Pontibacter sp. H249]|uniref:hypothetical protein n=1 Tax=Pontibacter sp. H249 TaxID=3133420 RepID=UPI0030C23C90
METWNEQQQRLGAVINNNLGITLKQQAEWLLPVIKKLEWYNDITEELVDPNLIGYYFTEDMRDSQFYGEYDEALKFCVMKGNTQEVDFDLIVAVAEIDEESYEVHICGYDIDINLEYIPWIDKSSDAVLDIAVPIRGYKIAKLLEGF